MPVPSLDLEPALHLCSLHLHQWQKGEVLNSSCIPQTHQVKFQLTLNKTLLHAIATHPLMDGALSITQNTKLGLPLLPALLFDSGFIVSKLKSFPSWEVIRDHQNGSLLCCLLGH